MSRIVLQSLLGLWLCTSAVAAELELRLVTDGDGKTTAVSASGLPAAELRRCADESIARALLGVAVIADDAQPLPSMLGAYTVEQGELRFTPRFAFREGTRYRASLARVDGKPVLKEFTIADAKPVPATRLAAIYPSAAVLPENQLKFYLHFSAPMGRGEAYEHVQLLKADGQPVDAPFLEIGEELWDASGKRLTLLIDPGRIKKGVKPREDLGPALAAGETYRLAVDGRWRDAAGKPLAASGEKRFKVEAAVESALDTKDWEITAPAAGTRATLTVQFPRPLDHALLGRAFRVHDPAGKLVLGESQIGPEERRWEFIPAKPWSPGVQRLIIDTVLEDLAGNRIGKAFEVDELRPLDKVVDVESVELPVLVK